METQQESAQRLYDRRAPFYDDSWHPSFAAHLVAIASLSPGERVLDLACGTGLVTFNAAVAVGEHGRVIGVDISTGMLEQARSKIKFQNISNVELYQHDITRLETLKALHGQTFDVITLASALVLLDDPSSAIKKWSNLLKAGGRLVVDVLSPHNLPLGLVLERTGRRLGMKVPYYRDWVKSSDSFKTMLEQAGFRVVRLVPVGQTGALLEYMDVAAADKMFDEQIGGDAYKELATKREARAIFRQELDNIADDGKVKVQDLVWVAVAQKPM